jgi:ribonuclease HI
MDRSGSLVLEELLCSPSPGGITCNIQNFSKLVMITCWYLWWSRRQIKNKEPMPSTESSIINIQGILANSFKLKGSGNLIQRDGWKRPATGVYKINVDAAFDVDTGRGATGAIIRDSRGNFVAASCVFTDIAVDATSMEASALLAGLQLAEQFGAQSLVVESDSLEVVRAVQNPSELRGLQAVVLDDCRHLLSMLGMATINHCPREANVDAHELARYGSTQGVGVLLFGSRTLFFLNPCNSR